MSPFNLAPTEMYYEFTNWEWITYTNICRSSFMVKSDFPFRITH